MNLELSTNKVLKGLIVIVIAVTILYLLKKTDNSSELIKDLQKEKENLHNEIISNHIRDAYYTDSLYNSIKKNVEFNKIQAKAISDKADNDFKTALKLIKIKNNEERNSVANTSIDSTISNVKRYYFPN